MTAKPDWKHTYTIREKDYTAVHVGLGIKGAFSFVTPENKKAYEATGDKRYLKTFTRMVVLTDKKSKKTTGFLMTLVPDKSYIESTHFDALRSNYKQWQKGYSGYVFYHALNGKFNNGWKFENGKVVKKVTQTSTDGIDINMGVRKKTASNLVCTDHIFDMWLQDCTYYFYNSESFTQDCGDWYYGYSYTITECVDDGTGDTGGGGGSDGGYTPPENPINEWSFDPCMQILHMNADYGLQSEDNRLLALTSGSLEYGSILKLNNDTPLESLYNYTPMVGIPSPTNDGGAINIDSYLQPNEKIDGYDHIHYDGLVPLFTADDIYKIYDLDANNHVNNLLTFTIQVITSHGVWTVKVDDVNQFKIFCQNYLNTEAKRTQINDDIKNWDIISGGAEKRFLELFQNSGIKLYENPVNNGNVIFSASNYTMRGLDNGVVTNLNCI